MSAEFIAEEGTLKGLILSLEKGDAWTIGRDPDLCDIVVEDSKVSRQHLVCRKTEEGFEIENLSESNPTLINGEQISSPTLLYSGDTVTIGGSVFRFYSEGMGSHEEIAFASETDIPEEGESFEEEDFDESETPTFVFDEPEEEEDQTIFEELDEEELPEVNIDLTEVTRFLLKVISGPNAGAEFALDYDHEYVVGTDTSLCDIVFNDLSVSREHARIRVSSNGVVSIEDTNSRNGVIVDGEKVKSADISPNSAITLGTTTFILIDREAPAETIAAHVYEQAEEKVPVEEPAAPVLTTTSREAVVTIPRRHLISTGALILALVIGGLAVLLGIGLYSLFQTEEVETTRRDYETELQNILIGFPGIRYTYNPSSGILFLMGHLSTGVEKNELLYKLRGLNFIKGIEDNVVNDEAVWQEMNILLSKHAEFKGISMHSPEPGLFVLSGYLQTEKQAANLNDYININFNYLNRLQNRVIVEQQVVENVSSRLLQQGFGAINVTFSNGELQLTGYVSSNQMGTFEKILVELGAIQGVRQVRNFVVAVSPEQGVVDLSQRYPGRFRVTGYSKHGDINVNVVINGKILTRGDRIDGMTVTSIQPHTIFLEKDGLKYKIDYNE